MASYQEQALENGLQVFSYPLPHLHSIEAALYFKAGPIYEEEGNFGISHLLQHMCLRNLNGIPKKELVSRLDAMGTVLQGFVYPEAIVFRMRFSPRFFDQAIELFSHFFVPGTWTGSEIDDEKAIVLRQIENEDPDFTSTTREHYWRTGKAVHPLRGTLASVKGISPGLLHQFKETVLRPANACFVLTGNFSKGMLASSYEIFSQWGNKGPSLFEQALPFNFCFRDEKSDVFIENSEHKAHVQLSFDINDELIFPICVDVLNLIVGQGPGSALYVALRDEQALTDEAASYVEEVGQFRRMVIEFSLPNLCLEEGIRGVFQVLYKLTQHISTRKFARSTVYFGDNLSFITDDALALNARLGWAYLSERAEEWEPEMRLKMYEDITKEDMLETAQTVFKPSNLCCYVCHNPAILPKEQLAALINEARLLLS